MMNLAYVCENLLDNCDMLLKVHAHNHVTLVFVVYGKVGHKYWKVIFDCQDIFYYRLNLDEEDDEQDWLLVLQAAVSLIPNLKDDKDFAWKIECEPTELTVVCENFDWQLSEIPESDYLKGLDACLVAPSVEAKENQ